MEVKELKAKVKALDKRLDIDVQGKTELGKSDSISADGMLMLEEKPKGTIYITAGGGTVMKLCPPDDDITVWYLDVDTYVDATMMPIFVKLMQLCQEFLEDKKNEN